MTWSWWALNMVTCQGYEGFVTVGEPHSCPTLVYPLIFSADLNDLCCKAIVHVMWLPTAHI
jgi:hypothetical protein